MDILKIVYDHINSGHPAGKRLERESTPIYCEKLFTRFDTDDSILDFTPASFKRLDKLLVTYHENLENQLSDEETVWFIRELAAYIGEVFMRNSNGTWEADERTSLFSSRIAYTGEWTLRKNNKKRMVRNVSYSPADVAISGWKKVLNGETPDTGLYFREVKGKYMVEEISYSKKYWPKKQ